MEKQTAIEIADNLPITGKHPIPSKKVQSFRNAATILKKLKQKHFVIRKIGQEYFIWRLL